MILGPLAAGLGLYCLRHESLRKLLVVLVTVAVALGAVGLAMVSLPREFHGLSWGSHLINSAMMLAEIGMAVYVIGLSLRYRKYLAAILMLVQAVILVGFEMVQGERLVAFHNLYVDKLSIVMALINGLMGGGICLYALSYMREYHLAHAEVKDRRPMFFAVLFVFMSAMFGIVFSNNLLWLYFFWEVTTLCSFLLIGYTQTDIARNNAFKALTMNLMGGVAFVLGVVWLHRNTGTIELQSLIVSLPQYALLPAALLCFAGITKSAQLPFSGWLLGAMVAPTPVSALLHSSTMVKAGVYLVLRMAPVITGTAVGMTVALVGAATFLVGSLAAITTSDAKKVLAYSTVANLGLIVLCGGIGTYEAVWAGVLLIIFHAVAKCLLFLCVGVVEHKLHSRDIEAMSGLILTMPKVSIMMLIGMAGMFLAPFGMLISKWAVLKAVVDASPALSIFIAFGSAATLFFWVKWMGKLIETTKPREAVVHECSAGEYVAMVGLSIGTFLTCLFFPFISSGFIEPYVLSIYGQTATMSPGNILLMMVMMAMVTLFPLTFVLHGDRQKVMDAYLGGANVQGSISYRTMKGGVQDVGMKNYYLGDFFDEARLVRWGGASCAALLCLMLALALA
jgi:ech hydrogenase subunit A